MFDHVRGQSDALQPSSSNVATRREGRTDRPTKCATNVILVWLRWDGDTIPFVGAVRQCAQQERFRLIDAQRTSDDAAVWRCEFEEAEPAPGLERRSQALLQHLSAIGPWLRAERVFQRSVAVEEDADEYLWEAFARRPLP